MNNETFIDRAKKYFGYLETEYGFKVIFENNSHNRPVTDGTIKYTSNKVIIIVDSEINQVAVRFVRLGDDENYYLDPISIHEYQTTNNREKSILLSTDPSNQNAAIALIKNKSLLTIQNSNNKEDNTNSSQENLMKWYADWIKHNTNLILSADLSKWTQFYEYKVNRLIANELRRGKKDVVKTVTRDENGKLKTIDRPLFQKEKDYLEKLKKELLIRNNNDLTA